MGEGKGVRFSRTYFFHSLDGVSLSTPVNEDFADFSKAESNFEPIFTNWDHVSTLQENDHLAKVNIFDFGTP